MGAPAPAGDAADRDPGSRCTTSRSPDDPTHTLTGLRDRDLLVVGPKGRGFRKTLHLGSVSEALVHNPPMPLVIARHGRPDHPRPGLR